MNVIDSISRQVTRRAFLGRSSAGMGMLALASLLKPELLAAADSGTGKLVENAPEPREQSYGAISCARWRSRDGYRTCS